MNKATSKRPISILNRNPSVTSSSLNAAAPLVRITRLPSTISKPPSPEVVLRRKPSPIVTATATINGGRTKPVKTYDFTKPKTTSSSRPPVKAVSVPSVAILKPKNDINQNSNNNNSHLVLNKNIQERKLVATVEPQQQRQQQQRRQPPSSIIDSLVKKSPRTR